MAKKRGSSWKSSVLWIIPIVFIIDRLFKVYAQDGCLWQFCISRAVNMGAAFGIFEGQTIFLIIVGVLVLFLILRIYKKSDKDIRLALILIAAGTLANLFDRMYTGGVIDIFSVFGSSSFNFADLSNVTGAVILIKALLVNRGSK